MRTTPLLYFFLNIIGANRLGEGGETTRGKTTSGGERTRGETTRGKRLWGKRLGEEMVWGRNDPDSS